MDFIRSKALESSKHLPNHQRLLKTLFQYFHSRPEASGVFLFGAAAQSTLNPFSDLDLGVLCGSVEDCHQLWTDLNKKKVSPWLGNEIHSQPFQVIYLAQPHIQISLNLYTDENLLNFQQKPYLVAWDKIGKLDRWSQDSSTSIEPKTNWSNVVHEDEQFWVWTHFSASTAARGDFHEVVHHLEDLREIVQSWQSRLDQMARKNFKKNGNRYQPEFLDRMKRTFCPPHADGIKLAYKNLIKIQLQQRALIEKTLAPRWTVSKPLISQIQNYSQAF